MLSRDQVIARVRDFKAKHGVVEEQDENVVTTLHLMNTHKLDLHAAQDHTSRGANDHGIDGWYFDRGKSELNLYQSKLTGSKALALKGLDDLVRACEWLGKVLATGEVETRATNGGIYNLQRCLAEYRESIRTVRCVLLSPFDANEMDDEELLKFTRTDLGKSHLYKLLSERGGSIDMLTEAYCFSGSSVVPPSTYTVSVKDGTALTIADRVRLDVALVSLRSLVELFRTRGTLIFEKNVRLFLNTKDSKARLEHPMEQTLDQICAGQLSPNHFTFFHVGVTLSAHDSTKTSGDLSLDLPYIINGCQTVNIASRFLSKLEKSKEVEKIRLFDEIQVVAKIITRASNDQLRDIANCNNRQNPIETWQLFSNDPVHGRIELELREIGVFYERQKGRFDAEIKSLRTLNTYGNTNNTFVTVVELGQVVCLCRQQLQLAAKPSEIFSHKDKHDAVFDGLVEGHPNDIVWAFNAHKAVKRGLANYLAAPSLDNEQTHQIFRKPIVKQSMHYLAMLHLYQKKRALSANFATKLNQKAAPTLVDEAQAFYKGTVKKTKEFYLTQSKSLSVEVSWKKLKAHVDNLALQLGLDVDGPMPFSNGRIEWEFDE